MVLDTGAFESSVEAGSGATPVVSKDAPTDESPLLGRIVLVALEVGEIPLMLLV
jgi:hypothetical protein